MNTLSNKKSIVAKFILLLFLVMSVIFIRLNMVTPSALDESVSFMTTKQLNVRSGPGTTYQKIGVVEKNTQVEVVENVSGWAKIVYGTDFGYISAKYITVIENQVTQTQPVTYEGEERELAVAIFDKVNEHRVAIGLNPLVWDETLYQVAQVRSTEIYTTWSHTRPNGQAPSTVFTEKKVKYRYAGENLARYFTNADNTLSAWLNSPAHKSAIENPNYNKTAVFVYRGPDGNLYGAQEFTD